MELRGKKVMVLGLARTGVETARFLVKEGAEVTVSDCKSGAELKGALEHFSGLPVRSFLGGENVAWLDGIEMLVPSPGVPEGNPLLREAGQRGIPILSEMELAYRFTRFPLMAITGTNGKSTTTTLIGEMLKARGLKTFVGGNIGAPLIGFLHDSWDWGVIEVSSFQLEWVEEFRPKVAVLLNLTEDHLDRYPDFVSYGDAKKRIFTAQTGADIAVLNRDDPLVWPLRERVRSRVVSFGWEEVRDGVYATSGEMIWRRESREEKFSLARVKIQGVHNVENMMAAIAAVKSVGVPAGAIQKVIEGFPGLEHRLEFVREKNGIIVSCTRPATPLV